MKKLVKNIDKKLHGNLIFNGGLIALNFLYLAIRFEYLNSQIPLWMTMPWGEQQLAHRNWIFLLPVLASIILVVGLFFINNAKKHYQRHGEKIISGIITLTNLLLTYASWRVVSIATSSHDPLFDPRLIQIIYPALIAFAIVYITAPKFIEKFKDKGIVTKPNKHQHPGMILKKPSARGGGVIFIIGVLVTSLFFIKLTPIMIGLFVSATFAAILGYLDDIQNTKSDSGWDWMENPKKRILLQIAVTLPLVLSGVVVRSINNPFNGLFHLDAWNFNFLNMSIAPIAIGFTILWIVWIMNLLSWSNGVDGQYSGVIGIAGIMIAIITLRLLHLEPAQKDIMELSAIVAGASLGLLPYGWHPSKIMWGFGAISAGVILASISVVSQAKIATSIIVLTVPFLDGAITIVRRFIQKKSLFKGDKGHLHHILLEKGWGVKAVAVFYWVTTALFGLVGVFAADRDPILAALTGLGVVAFIIISLNVTAHNLPEQ